MGSLTEWCGAKLLEKCAHDFPQCTCMRAYSTQLSSPTRPLAERWCPSVRVLATIIIWATEPPPTSSSSSSSHRAAYYTGPHRRRRFHPSHPLLRPAGPFETDGAHHTYIHSLSLSPPLTALSLSFAARNMLQLFYARHAYTRARASCI